MNLKEQQKILERETERYTGMEREKPTKIYFEFKNEEQRNQAKSLLNKLYEERHEYDDMFRYFVECKADPGRKDVGLEISFSKNPEGLENKIEGILSENGLMPSEEYETVDEEPRPNKTKINK